ncbi:MAG: Ig-like domain repeat protein [Proteobacteria bacterium]|nr:Ig-like domain repeat protein [Pseudomonadota bacterium]
MQKARAIHGGRARGLLIAGLSAAALATAGAANAVGVSTVTTLTPSSYTANAGGAGSTVFFTATVTSLGGGTVTGGTVQFLDDGAFIGTSAVSGGTATASFAFACPVATVCPFAAVGTHSITANYSGNSNFLASSSPGVTETIYGRTTTALSSDSSVVLGDFLNLTADVGPLGTGGTPTGDVSFFDGSTLLGTASLDGSDVASLQIDSRLLNLGVNQLTAAYAGAGFYLASTSSNDSVTVNVPEPASWALLILGFATAGAALRRRTGGVRA